MVEVLVILGAALIGTALFGHYLEVRERRRSIARQMGVAGWTDGSHFQSCCGKYESDLGCERPGGCPLWRQWLSAPKLGGFTVTERTALARGAPGG